MAEKLSRRLTSVTAAFSAFGFLLHNFRQLLRLTAVPALATGAVVYASLWAYLSELIAFVLTRDARAASVALGALTAGVFICMFFVAISVSLISDLMLRNRRERGWIHLHAGRQEWRIYAAYLRLFMLLSVFWAVLSVVSGVVLPVLGVGRDVNGALTVFAALGGFYGLYARAGFLIAPLVFESNGPVLRRAMHEGAGQFRRNFVVVLLLCIPGFAIQFVGEILFQAGNGAIRGFRTDIPIVLYARALQHRLPEFSLLFTVSIFATLMLWTIAAVYCYRDRSARNPDHRAAMRAVTTPDSVPV